MPFAKFLLLQKDEQDHPTEYRLLLNFSNVQKTVCNYQNYVNGKLSLLDSSYDAWIQSFLVALFPFCWKVNAWFRNNLCAECLDFYFFRHFYFGYDTYSYYSFCLYFDCDFYLSYPCLDYDGGALLAPGQQVKLRVQDIHVFIQFFI